MNMTNVRSQSRIAVGVGCGVLLAASAVVAACGSSLTNEDTGRLHNAQADLYLANNGHVPENNAQIAYCQIHCVLMSAGQASDPDGGTLPCPPCSPDAGPPPEHATDAGAHP
jgi:hypothetical protein